MDEPIIIAVMPLEHCVERTAGAIEVKCWKCSTICSAATSTQEYLKVHPDAKIECLTCIAGKSMATGDPVTMQPVPGAMEECAEHFRTDLEGAKQKMEEGYENFKKMMQRWKERN